MKLENNGLPRAGEKLRKSSRCYSVSTLKRFWRVVRDGHDNIDDGKHSLLYWEPAVGGAWWAAVHGVAKSRTWLNDFTFTFHFHALEKEMATHSSVLAWRIPGTGEPRGLPSMGSHGVGHNWSDLAAAAAAAAAVYQALCRVSAHGSSHWIHTIPSEVGYKFPTL